MIYNYPIFKEGERLTAHDLNVMLDEILRRNKLFAAPPLYLQDGPGGTTLTYADNEWYGVLCGHQNEGYVVCEVVRNENAQWELLASGRTGFAKEFNENSDIPEGKVVRIYPGFGNEYIFDCYATSITVAAPCSCCVSSCSSSSPSSSSSSESSESSESSFSSGSSFSSDSSFSSESSGSSASSVSSASSSGSCAVDADTLAGPGLVATINEETGCPCLAVSTGCGVRLDGSDRVSLDLETIAYLGLTGDNDSCRLQVDTGCGLRFASNQLAVDLEQIAGDALTGNNTECKLNVNTGCGLDIDDNDLVVDFEIFQDGLVVNEGECYTVAVDPGCGISIHPDSKKVQVELEDFDGDGLTVVTPEAGCKKLAVDPGCGIEINAISKKVQVALEDFDGDGLKVITPDAGCKKLAVDVGTGIAIVANKVTWNPAIQWVLINKECIGGVERLTWGNILTGAATYSNPYTFNQCVECVTCSLSSSSMSSDSSSSSGSSDSSESSESSGSSEPLEPGACYKVTGGIRLFQTDSDTWQNAAAILNNNGGGSWTYFDIGMCMGQWDATDWDGIGCKTFTSVDCFPSSIQICQCSQSPGATCAEAGFIPFGDTFTGIAINNGQTHWWVAQVPAFTGACFRVYDVSGVGLNVTVFSGSCESPFNWGSGADPFCVSVSTGGAADVYWTKVEATSGTSGVYTINVETCPMC